MPRPETPVASVIIVSAGALSTLTFAMSSLREMTSASRIELIVVARRGVVDRSELRALHQFARVELLETDVLTDRWLLAVRALPLCTAPFVVFHENHVQSAPTAYERCIEQLDTPGNDDVAGIAPIFRAANPWSAWGNTMFAMSHLHVSLGCAGRECLELSSHQTLYRRAALMSIAAGDGSETLVDEAGVQRCLVKAGFRLLLADRASVRHINESRPVDVLHTAWRLSRAYGARRSRSFGTARRLAHVAACPMVAALALRRFRRVRHADPELAGTAMTSLLPMILCAVVFATGETVGVVSRRSPRRSVSYEMHEFDVESRLAGARMDRLCKTFA